MRILDEDNDIAIKKVTLLLTKDEARELRDALERMVERPVKWDHEHVDDREFQHEITTALYDPDVPGRFDENSGFDKRIRKLILEDS